MSTTTNNDAARTDEEYNQALDEAVLNLTILDEDAANRQTDAINARMRQHGLDELPGKAPDTPDVPPCDACGQDFSGSLACSRCQSVFYCSKECQRHDWKYGGHKQQCAHMKEQCHTTATEVLAQMTGDPDLEPYQRVAGDLFERMAGAGPYKAALALDLNGAIQEWFQRDIDELVERWTAFEGTFVGANKVSYTKTIMCDLFRGGRREGLGASTRGAFSRVDTYRCRSYVLSSPNAFETWFEASLKMAILMLHRDMLRLGEGARLAAHRTARDVVAAWSFVFTDKRISKAIILGITKQADDTAIKRGKWIVKQLKATLPKFWSAPDGIDSGGTIEGNLNQIAGMIQYRLKEFGVNVGGDFVKLLGLKGTHKVMFLRVGVPFAEATIRKGRSLDNAEAAAILNRR